MEFLILSRKFWIAVWSLILTVVMTYLDVPLEIIASIDAVAMALIAAIAYEDGQQLGEFGYATGVVFWKSRKVWLAIWALVQTCVMFYLPEFSEEIIMAANAVVILLIGAIAYEDGQYKSQTLNLEDRPNPDNPFV